MKSILIGFEMDGVFYIMWVPYGQNIIKFSAYKQGQFVVNQEYNIEFKYSVPNAGKNCS